MSFQFPQMISFFWGGGWEGSWDFVTGTSRFAVALRKFIVQLKCDGTRWSTGEEVKGKLANVVGSQYPSHYLGTWCIQHYYRWCAHLGCQQSTELESPADLNVRRKWTRPDVAAERVTGPGTCYVLARILHVSCSAVCSYRWQYLNGAPYRPSSSDTLK